MSTPKSWQRYMALGVFSAEAPRGYGCVPAEILEEIEAPVTGRALLAETERRDTLWSAVKEDLTRRAASDQLHQLSIADINPGPLPTEYQTEPTPNYARPLTGQQPATLGDKGPLTIEALVAPSRTADQILDSAAAALRDRAACRDIAGERSMARCIKAFNALTGQDLSEFQGWLFMGVLKYARATAGNPQLDDLIDAAGYSALAGESIFHKAEMQTMSGVMDTP